MKIRPLHDRILLKATDDDDMSAGGIFIPDVAKGKGKSIDAEVIAVGPGKRLEDGSIRKPELKKGQLVVIEKYAGTNIEIQGSKFRMVPEDEILAVYE